MFYRSSRNGTTCAVNPSQYLPRLCLLWLLLTAAGVCGHPTFRLKYARNNSGPSFFRHVTGVWKQRRSHAHDMHGLSNATHEIRNRVAIRSRATRTDHHPLQADVGASGDAIVNAALSAVRHKEHAIIVPSDNFECGYFSRSGPDIPRSAKIVVGVVTHNDLGQINEKTVKLIHPFLQQRLSQSALEDSISIQYFSNSPLPNLPTWSDSPKKLNYDQASDRYLHMIRHVFNGCLQTELDWFMLLDDDAVFDPRRLVAFTAQVQSVVKDMNEIPLVFARDAKWSPNLDNLPSAAKPSIKMRVDSFEEKQSEEFAFGGNGILFSSASLYALKKYAGKDWPSIFNENWIYPRSMRWFESRIFYLLKTVAFPCSDMFHYLEYAFGVSDALNAEQDQLHGMEKQNVLNDDNFQKRDASRAAFTLHKVFDKTDLRVAAKIFDDALSCPTVDCSSYYGANLHNLKFSKCS